MALPAPGNPISANMINVEANRTGTEYAPLSVNEIPVSTSLIGLYVDSGVNQLAPHKYSEFYSITFVQPDTPFWFVNTTNTPSIGKKYYLSNSFVIPNPTAVLSTNINTDLSAYGGSGLAINSNERLVIGGSVEGTALSASNERHSLLMSFNQTTGVPATAKAMDFQGTVYHWTSNLHFIDGFTDKVFWLDQEDQVVSSGQSTRRRYGVVNIDVTQSGSTIYPPLWQYTGQIRRINNTQYKQSNYYSSPKAVSVNFTQSVSPYTDSSRSYVYVCNQVKNVSSANGFNGSIIRMTYYDDVTPLATGGASLSSPLWKLYEQNPGAAGSPWSTSDMTTFADLCVIPYNGGGPF